MEMARRFFLVGVFVDVAPGTITQVAIGTLFCALFLLVQLQASPYRSRSDDYLACASSFSLLVLFLCATIYKYDALTSSEDVQSKMSLEQKDDYVMDSLLLSFCVTISVVGALASAAVILCVQVAAEARQRRSQKRLRYKGTDEDVVLVPPEKTMKYDGSKKTFHIFLSVRSCH